MKLPTPSFVSKPESRGALATERRHLADAVFHLALRIRHYVMASRVGFTDSSSSDEITASARP